MRPHKTAAPFFQSGRRFLSCEVPQILFHILILNAIHHLAFSAVEDKLPGDWAIAMLRLGTLFRVDQMALLLRRSFFAVLDLENPTRTGVGVKHHHIKLAYRELQHKHLLFRVRQLGFQQDDLLQHAVDGTGQFIFAVQVPQMAEMPFVLVAAQGVLDVAGNGRVHIFVGTFLAGEGRGFVVVDAAKTHGAAVVDILVDTVDTEDGFKLTVGAECCVQQDAAVVELLIRFPSNAKKTGFICLHRHRKTRIN